ncbi:uncharacterized protein CANTADRAFT_90368 [Suhomyces tanzawaensis NRRL Y-17324]|uniref:guanosine-diphosphatase n=1 Tax=Suhomyces tanzawaensis NRRL Y-17324 TaxID=984487 RepID=A0A1E4SIF8_9ASCO|nr:uncharacterized protein CANTADRAFT_90368 [Suhomyces tanzawaensis NRRL Y-17324]ODV79279.1 hypothetical protein CANTADRAFT_90368 [Suhomyces tanzawaensis NRRL Y-17324]
MISTRNIRVIVSVLAIFGIVTFFAMSQNSLGDNVQRVQPAASSDDHVPFKEHPEPNNIKGTPQSVDPPYSQSDKAGGANSKPKVIADKIGTDTPTSGDSKPAAGTAAKAPAGGSKPKTGVSGTCDKKEYVVMIDAGSTGSRVHVYEFDTCQAPPKLLKEEFKMLNPGLSSFDTDTKGAAASLDPLLKVALETVPKDKQACTPVAVKATAGLRMLGEEKANNILAEVRRHLEKDYPFAVVEGDGISIMDGRDEGVYAWVTANYLLGNIGSSEKTPTAAVFDLGGGSTQIVFEPEFGNNEKMVEGEHKYEFLFGDRDFTLYQYSHLGFGLMQGRNKINGLVVQSALNSNPEVSKSKISSKADAKKAKATLTINNPCIAPGVVAENVLVELGADEFYVVNMKGPSVANGAQCRFLAEKVLDKEKECTTKPCSFNGVHQPSLTKAFRRSSDMYVFSFFYDRTNPLGFPSSFTVEELTELAKVVCNGELLWKDVLLDDHVKQLKEEPQWCLDLSFVTALLHTGYDIPLHRELRTAQKIDNNEIGWCLGASLPLLDGKGWKCRIDQVA